MNFPSGVTGFGGTLFSETKDPELGLACVRAWNDWLFEEWYGSYPERIVPLGITYLADPEKGAEEIRRNAKRGFTAVTMPEQPHRSGFPSVFDDYWEPIIRACAETETVLNLHVGSSGFAEMPPGAPLLELGATLFQAMASNPARSGCGARGPRATPSSRSRCRRAASRWVGGLIDRSTTSWGARATAAAGPTRQISPSDVLRRNFWFCMIDDPSTISTHHAIGVENILFESDYPHGDGTWPDTQEVMRRCSGICRTKRSG